MTEDPLATEQPTRELEPTPTVSPIEQPSKAGGPWTPVSLAITSTTQLAAETQLPETFREFMGRRLGVEDDAGCTISAITVKGTHPDGFVFGSEDSTCGDSQAVWGITENAWHYIVAFGDAIPCTEFGHNQVPTGAPGLRCIGDDGQARDY